MKRKIIRKIHKLLARQDQAKLAARLERRLAKQHNGCIEWAGARNNDGYAKMNFWQDGVPIQLYVHRVFWVLANKREIPSHLVLDHTCENRACVNPAHLDLVMQKTNLRRIHDRRTVDHLCGDPSCTNVECLQIVEPSNRHQKELHQ